MSTNNQMKKLVERTIAIDYEHRHFHLPGSLGALPVIAEIFNCFADGLDVFILSKGHAAAALYAVLERYGYHPDCSNPHPERDPDNGITCTTGSLGHGLPMAVGIALGKKLAGDGGMVHVLIGDGEAMEGTTWESILLAGAWRLDNLTVHVDGNGTGCLADLPCDTRIIETAAQLAGVNLIWRKTVKGCGVKSLEGTKDHVLPLTAEDVAAFMGEVEERFA